MYPIWALRNERRISPTVEFQPILHHLVELDFEKDIRAALQVEAEGQGVMGRQLGIFASQLFGQHVGQRDEDPAEQNEGDQNFGPSGKPATLRD